MCRRSFVVSLWTFSANLFLTSPKTEPKLCSPRTSAVLRTNATPSEMDTNEWSSHRFFRKINCFHSRTPKRPNYFLLRFVVICRARLRTHVNATMNERQTFFLIFLSTFHSPMAFRSPIQHMLRVCDDQRYTPKVGTSACQNIIINGIFVCGFTFIASQWMSAKYLRNAREWIGKCHDQKQFQQLETAIYSIISFFTKRMVKLWREIDDTRCSATIIIISYSLRQFLRQAFFGQTISVHGFAPI